MINRISEKKNPSHTGSDFSCHTFKRVGAGGRGRTDTVSLPLDFESSTSANSITPAYLNHPYILHYFIAFVNTFLLKTSYKAKIFMILSALYR